jgi:hypothetical protein
MLGGTDHQYISKVLYEVYEDTLVGQKKYIEHMEVISYREK